ncbi:hypothetical protein AB4Y38_02300 [Paraburkholderia sp. EG285A]|uniref:hypothetical protein n=1 Tax=Paraburkholderia sp. EG285A TaxID=3237009 RepID=UPI0034D34376
MLTTLTQTSPVDLDRRDAATLAHWLRTILHSVCGNHRLLIIDFEEGAIELRAGQLLTIPAGVRHRTRPGGARSINLTVEKANATTIRCDAPREG